MLWKNKDFDSQRSKSSRTRAACFHARKLEQEQKIDGPWGGSLSLSPQPPRCVGFLTFA